MAKKAQAEAPETENTEAQAATPAKEKAPKIERAKQNGFTRPKDGSITGRVWTIADEISAKLGEPAPRKQVIEQAVSEGLNPSMSASQYSRWRGFHGLVGRSAPGKADKADEAPAAPEAPAATEEAGE